MKTASLVLVSALAALGTLAATRPPAEGVYVNSDAWNFWIDEKMASMGREELKAAIERDVDFYAAKGVRAVLYNMNIQRCFYPTKAATPFWKDVAVDADGRMLLRGKFSTSDATLRTMFRAVTNMVAQFPEYMRHRYDHCHKKGIEMWHSFRVSDVHGTALGGERGLHSDLWLDHKEVIRAWYRHAWRGEWPDGTLDYANKRVYDTQLATVRELLLDYPSDGIGFDWLRACPVLKPGFADRDRGVLTRFLRDVRRIADEAEKKWGHEIRMAHRMPARVRDAWGAGFDVPAWAKEGLVDVLVVGGTPATTTEQDCDVALYRALAPKPVVIAAEIDCSVFARHGWYESIDNRVFGNEIDAGFASSFYQQGADTIYFYNHFPRHGAKFPWVREMFAQASDRRTVAAMARRHPATYHIRVGESRLDEPAFPAEIWAKCCNGGVNLCCGEGNEGRAAKVVVGATTPLDVEVLVNTVSCGRAKALEDASGYPAGKAKTTYYAVDVPKGVLHDGVNNVELFNHGDKTIAGDELVWMEIAVSAAEGGGLGAGGGRAF
ncbi:MAG: hypothetical protein MJ138_04380 [Kiritimatiellae bacterium]|nr:hypothetical protein [Kiritimatiellia bacterium]